MKRNKIVLGIGVTVAILALSLATTYLTHRVSDAKIREP